MADDTFQLEAYSNLLQGGITYILVKPDTPMWIPYEFLPATIQSKVLICGQDKTALVREEWKYIIQNPSMQDWSVLCSIIKHIPPPAVVYVTREVHVPPQALQYISSIASNIGATMIVERSDTQSGLLQFPTMNTLFFPVLQHQQIQGNLPLFQSIFKQTLTIKALDIPGLLQQVAPTKLGLVLAKTDGKWLLYWYKPEESRLAEVPKQMIGGWLRSFATMIDS